MFWRIPLNNENIDNSSSAQEHYEQLLSKPLGVQHLIDSSYRSYYVEDSPSVEDREYYNTRMLSNALSTVGDIEEYFNAIANSNYGVGTLPSAAFRERWPLFKEYLDTHTNINEYGDAEVTTDAGRRVPLRYLSKELNDIYCQVYSEDIKDKLLEVSQASPGPDTMKKITLGFGTGDNNVLYFLHNFTKFPEMQLENSNMYVQLKSMTDAALSEILSIDYEDISIESSAFGNSNPMHYMNVIRSITETLQGIHPYAVLYLEDKNLPTSVFQHLYNFIPHGPVDEKKKLLLDEWMRNLHYVFEFLQKVISFDKIASTKLSWREIPPGRSWEERAVDFIKNNEQLLIDTIDDATGIQSVHVGIDIDTIEIEEAVGIYLGIQTNGNVDTEQVYEYLYSIQNNIDWEHSEVIEDDDIVEVYLHPATHLRNKKTSSKDDSMDYNLERGQFTTRWSPDDESGGALDSLQFQDSMYQDYFTIPDIRSDIDTEVMEFQYAPPLGGALQFNNFIKKTADPLTYTDSSDFDRNDNYTNQADFVNSTNVDGGEMRDGTWGETDWRFFNPTDVFDTIDDSNDYAAQPVLAGSSKDEIFICLKAPDSVRNQFKHVAKLEDDLHVTLLFLKRLKLNTHAQERVLKELATVAKAYSSITCKSNGVAVFNNDDTSHVMLVNAKNISKLHNDLKDAVAAAHSDINSKYDFIPHMTLRNDSNGKANIDEIPEVSWNNRSFFVRIGDEFEYRIAFGTGKITELNLANLKFAHEEDSPVLFPGLNDWHDNFHEYDDVDDFETTKKQYHHDLNPIRELRTQEDYEADPETNSETSLKKIRTVVGKEPYRGIPRDPKDISFLREDDGTSEDSLYVERIGNGETRYYDSEDRMHRLNEPAYTDRRGSAIWYHHGKVHRGNDLPAIELFDGTKEWYKDDIRHRDNDLPSITWKDGSKYWYEGKKLHRGNLLPAVEKSNGITEYWEDGERFYPGIMSSLLFNLDNSSKFSNFNSSNHSKEISSGELKVFSEDTRSEGQEEAQEAGQIQNPEEIQQVNQEPERSIVYPNIDDIFDMHENILEHFGGKQGYNELTGGKVSAAIGRMQSGFGDGEFYISIIDKAAVLIHSIVSTHPFNDGNKRTGMMSGIEFMEDNGFTIDDSDHLADTIVSLATSNMSLDQMITYMNEHSYEIVDSHILDKYQDTMRSLSWKRDISDDNLDIDTLNEQLADDEYYEDIEYDEEQDNYLGSHVTNHYVGTKQVSSEQAFAIMDNERNAPGTSFDIYPELLDFRSFHIAVRNYMGEALHDLIGIYTDDTLEIIVANMYYSVDTTSSLKFAGFDDTTNPNDISPKEEIPYGDTEKKENEGIVRNRFHNEEAELIYEVGLHQDINTPETNRPLTPYASHKLAWREETYEHKSKDDFGGTRYYNADNELHRLGNYAAVEEDGTRIWYINGEIHREDGPAIIYLDGTKEWFQNDDYHRLDGPAIERSDGHKAWYIDGKQLTEEEFNNRIQNISSVLYKNRKI